MEVVVIKIFVVVECLYGPSGDNGVYPCDPVYHFGVFASQGECDRKRVSLPLTKPGYFTLRYECASRLVAPWQVH